MTDQFSVLLYHQIGFFRSFENIFKHPLLRRLSGSSRAGPSTWHNWSHEERAQRYYGAAVIFVSFPFFAEHFRSYLHFKRISFMFELLISHNYRILHYMIQSDTCTFIPKENIQTFQKLIIKKFQPNQVFMSSVSCACIMTRWLHGHHGQDTNQSWSPTHVPPHPNNLQYNNIMSKNISNMIFSKLKQSLLDQLDPDIKITILVPRIFMIILIFHYW